MTRSVFLASLSLAAMSAAALAGAAVAQPAPGAGYSPPVDNRPVDATNAVTLRAGDVPQPLGSVAPNVQPDVTVRGQPLREPCKPRDLACIHAVTAELWRRYPDEIRTLCIKEQTYRFKEGFILSGMGVEGANLGRVTPQTQALCSYGDRLKRRQGAAAKAAAATTPDTPGEP